MECTLATLVACFSWSNLYIDIGIQFQDRGDSYYVTQLESFERQLPNGVIESGTEFVTRSYDLKNNPYGRLALGYELDFRSIVLSLEAAHISSLATSEDHGINSISIGVRWYPFKLVP